MQSVPSLLFPTDGAKPLATPACASRNALVSAQGRATGLEPRREPFAAHLDRKSAAGGRPHQRGVTDREPGQPSSEDSEPGGAGSADLAQDARAQADRSAEVTEQAQVGVEGEGVALNATQPSSSAGEFPGTNSGPHKMEAQSNAPMRGYRSEPSTAMLEAQARREHAEAGRAVGTERDHGGQRPSAARTRLASLTTLLEKHGASAAPTPKGSVNPALARAEQIQQVIALEHAAQQISPGTRLPQGRLQALALESGGDNARQNVLAELTAREGGDLKVEARTRMLAARAVGALASQRGGTLTMRLDPPSLGDLSLRMTVLDGVVRAELTASSNAARALLVQGLDALRATLEMRGLHVERLSVQGPTSGSESTALRADSQHQGSSSNSDGVQEDGMDDDRKDAAGRESRGRGGERREHQPEETSGRGGTFKEALEHDWA